MSFDYDTKNDLDFLHVSTYRPRVRALCLPDIDRPIGGVKQLYRHVEHLDALGWDAAILCEKSGFRPNWFTSTANCISLTESNAKNELVPSECILLLPETYIGMNFSQFNGIDLSEFSRVVFNQNAYYSYGQSANIDDKIFYDFYESSSVLQVLSVSEDTHRFLHHNMMIPDNRLSRIINAIESSFKPTLSKKNILHWMPRKNSDHVNAILHGLKRARFPSSQGWIAEPLIQLNHNEVSDRLNQSRIFLAFGHPEGFGLPIAEAMAADCWVIGYSGGGGDELFRYGASESVNFGDWRNFLLAIEKAFINFADQPRETLLRLQRQSLVIKSLYSYDQERASVDLAWSRVYEAFKLWLNSSR